MKGQMRTVAVIFFCTLGLVAISVLGGCKTFSGNLNGVPQCAADVYRAAVDCYDAAKAATVGAADGGTK